MVITTVKRRRVKDADVKRSSSAFKVRYYVTNKEKKKVPVCISAFLRIVNVSKARLNTIAKKVYNDGFVSDARGGFKQAARYDKQKDDIMSFIRSLKTKESHYCRNRTERRYLPSELSINKLYKMYNDSRKDTNFEEVKPSYFRFIFNTKFNIGFGSPVTDACSLCLSLKGKLKRCQGRKKVTKA